MATRKGTLLERNLVKIFEKAGFNTQHQARVKGYEIDVLAKKGNKTIVVECKQYEGSTLQVRNLIHLWDSKNKEIGADKVILAVYGEDITPQEKLMAYKYGMILWDEDDMEKISDLLDDKQKLISLLDRELNIKFEKSEEELDIELADDEEPLTPYIKITCKGKTLVKKARVRKRILLTPIKKVDWDKSIEGFFEGKTYYRVGFGVQLNEEETLYILEKEEMIICISPRNSDIDLLFLSNDRKVVDIRRVDTGFRKKFIVSENPAKYIISSSKYKLKGEVRIRDKINFIEIR